MKKFCCEELEDLFNEGMLDKWNNLISHDYYVEGDGYVSDSTTIKYITYCPFCGTKINNS